MISPIFETLAANSDQEKVEFYNIDVDAVPDVAQEVGIKAVSLLDHFTSEHCLIHLYP